MLYKRGSKWWVRFTARGREIRVTSGTDRRELAEEFEQRLREAIWREKALGQEIHTWEEACERWFREKSHKRSLRRDHQAIAALRLSGPLNDMGWDSARDKAKPRELAVLRSILNAAVRWGWLDKAPRIQISAPKKQEPRWITQEQFEALCDQLPPHAERIARFAVATGLRASNIFRLAYGTHCLCLYLCVSISMCGACGVQIVAQPFGVRHEAPLDPPAALSGLRGERQGAD